MNNCFFDGRLVRDPELKTLPTGAKVVNFSLAISSLRKTKEGQPIRDVHFLDFEAWDSGAELIAKNCGKGDILSLNCSAKTDKWTADDGTNRSKVKFRVNSFTQYSGYGSRKNQQQQEEVAEVAPEDGGGTGS